MTIDSGWVKILKDATPSAFQTKAPFTPACVFIDGQINLMKSAHVTTWKQFVLQQFVKAVEKGFHMGADTVILAFDNYAHVPTAKHATQRRRNQKVAPFDFESGQELPSVMPYDWASAMRMKPFKVRVIQMVVCAIEQWFITLPEKFTANRTLLIDAQDIPIVLGMQRPLPALFDDTQGIGRGECDIKAFAWLEWGPLLIMSTDGDYVPISLLQLEKRALQNSPLPQIALFRLATNVGEKRPASTKARGRQYEFVHINPLLDFVQAECSHMHATLPVTCFAMLVAMTGCDFSMNLPSIGPVRAWDTRRSIHIDGVTHADIFIAIAACYCKSFASATGVSIKSLNHETCSSAYTRMSMHRPRLWPLSRMSAHSRNVWWTLQYWTHLHAVQDPLTIEDGLSIYGYSSNLGKIDFVA